MQISNYSTSALYSSQYYNDLVHLEKDNNFWIGEALPGNDFRNFTNEKFLGEGWYWKLLVHNLSISDTVSLPLLYPSPRNATIRIFAYPVVVSLTIF